DGRRPIISTVDIKMIVPMVCQHLEQLAFAIHTPQERGLFGFPHWPGALVPVDPFFTDMVGPKLRKRFSQRLKLVVRQNRVTGAVVDGRRIQLLFYIGGKGGLRCVTQRAEGGNITRSW